MQKDLQKLTHIDAHDDGTHVSNHVIHLKILRAQMTTLLTFETACQSTEFMWLFLETGVNDAFQFARANGIAAGKRSKFRSKRR